MNALLSGDIPMCLVAVLLPLLAAIGLFGLSGLMSDTHCNANPRPTSYFIGPMLIAGCPR